tara:strand:+ start:658 stop:2289 length:1632 start_codon:yes stop_codon:yes gene_type:complete
MELQLPNKISLKPGVLKILLCITFIFDGCQSSKPPILEEAAIKNSPRELIKDPDPEALRLFMNGQMLMNQGDFAMAIIEFQEALELDPEVGTIYTSIAECYWNIGKPELSLKNLNVALSKNPEDEEALKMMADQLIATKKYDEAIKPFKKLSELDGQNTSYIIALAELNKLKKNYLNTVNLYLEAYAIEPSRIELLESAGRYALQLENKDKAKSIFKDLSEQDPFQSSYLNIYSELAIQTKNFEEAISHIQKLINDNGDSSLLKSKLGILYHSSGNSKKGEEVLKALFDKNELNGQHSLALFEIYFDNKDNINAAKVSDRMIASLPEDWRGYYSRSLVFMDESDYESAVSILAPVSETFSNIFSVQYILGLCYSRIKMNDEAIDFYNRALTIRPNSINVLHSIAILYDDIGEWVKSDKIYDQLIDNDPKDAQAFNNYAYSLVERNKDLKRALIYAKKAVELEPKNPSYLDTIGWAYFKMDDLKRAKKYIRQSIEIQDDNSVVLEHFGDILMKSNDSVNALFYYKKAFEFDNENQELKKKAFPD